MERSKLGKDKKSFKMKCLFTVLALILMLGSFGSASQAATYEVSYIQEVEFDFNQFWINYLNYLQYTKPDLVFKSMDLCVTSGTTIGRKTLKGTITLQNIAGNYGVNSQYQVRHKIKVFDGYSGFQYYDRPRESYSYVPFSFGTVSYNVSWQFYENHLPTTFWIYLDVDNDVDELGDSNFFQYIHNQSIPSCQ